MSETKAPASSVHVVDMRSDTVTKPTAAMRAAMAAAEVGDDVFADDPTVNLLQETAAALLGKEAALFVSSGTQGNLLACLIHCRERGSEMILGDKSHIHTSEGGGSAFLGGIHSRTVATAADGTLDLAEIKSKIRPLTDDHAPVTKLICLENTHNRNGGRVLSVEYTNSVAALAKANNLKFHIDGARLPNAAVALGVSMKSLVEHADSVSVCLSKGLAAPIGSVLAGSKEFITLARKYRKALGGGMRQVGVLAAAGLISLNTMIPRLADDHANMHLLATELNKIDGIKVDPATAPTNIAFINIDESLASILNADKLTAALATPAATHIADTTTHPVTLKSQTSVRIAAISYPPLQVRFLTHNDISRDDVLLTIQRVRTIVGEAQQVRRAATA